MKNTQKFLSVVGDVFKGFSNIQSFKNIPLMYQDLFDIFCVDYEDEQYYVFCFDNYEELSTILSYYHFLKKTKNKTFVYVPDSLKKHLKNNLEFLVDNKVSFVTDKGRFYCDGTLDFADELSTFLTKENKNNYTKQTQLVFKFYLFNPIDSYTVRHISNYLGISASGVSRANELLFNLGVLSKDGYFKSTKYTIINKKKALKTLEPYFLKPYENTIYLQVSDEDYKTISSYPYAGQFALSEYTLLLPSSKVPVFAIEKTVFENMDFMKDNDSKRFVAVQTYIYDSKIYTDCNSIDLFDLYVTMLKDENLNNPRVKESLNEIKKQLLNKK